jgi:hypothetical protein
VTGGDSGNEEGKESRKNKILSVAMFATAEVPGDGVGCYVAETETNSL